MTQDKPKSFQEDEEQDTFTEKTVVRPEITRSEVRSETPPCLVIWLPKSRRGEQITLDRNITFGRSASCDMAIDDPAMSGKHAKFIVDYNSIYVQDLKSTNSTFLDREPIAAEKPIQLQSNCSIRMGSTVLMFYKKGSIEAGNLSNVFKEAYLDPLTETLNKRALLERGPELLGKAKQFKNYFSLMIFDLDLFKKVNDTFGHAAGDFVLKEVAALVQTTLIRIDDIFSRFGGEEFVITLYGANITKAVEISERIRKEVDRHNFFWQGNNIAITISIGVTELRSSSETWDELFERADKALYQSKQTGRNKVSKL